jgi:hypothetical protein
MFDPSIPPNKAIQSPLSDSLRLNVVVPHRCITPVFLSGQCLVGRIEEEFPGRIFLYDGQILDRNRTFSFYRIRSEDCIIAVLSESSRVELEQWRAKSRDREAFHGQVHPLMDPRLRGVMYRLQDFRERRSELRPRQWRREVAGFLPSIEVGLGKKKCEPTVIPELPMDLSCEPLPVSF